MKKAFLLLAFIAILLPTASAQKEKVNFEPKGRWTFEAPYAPEGFTAGVIEVAMADKKYSATIAFTGNESLIPLDNVKFDTDSLTAVIYLQGESVGISLKFLEADKLSGKAIYSEGTVPLTAVREKKK